MFFGKLKFYYNPISLCYNKRKIKTNQTWILGLGENDNFRLVFVEFIILRSFTQGTWFSVDPSVS